MNKRQQMLQRMLRALLPVVILSRIIIGSLGISRAQIKAGTDHNFAKARVTAILSDYSDNTPFNGPQQVRAVLISGTWKGQEVEPANSIRLNVGQLLYSGILISSLGAVMDVSVSVAAAIEEIHEKAPKLPVRELFRSGMHIGHDMIGTMSNTLILAYTGSATGALMTLYSYEMPFLQVMGYNSIVIEILCGLCGTIGVILTVPIQAAITAFALRGQVR